MYLSKETILKAYDVLSKATPSVLNNFSAIQYFVATDRFFKKNGKPCDSSSSKSKAEFYGYVEEVVLLDDNNYLSSFKTIYEGNKSVSSTVSSNFFSGSSVEHSNNTSGKKFDYPKKGPLLYALDGKVYKEETYYTNLSDYLKSNEETFALAIWLLRQSNDFENTTVEEIRRNLEAKYSSLLVKTLIPSNITDTDGLTDIFTISLSEDKPCINKNDISKKDHNVKFSGCNNVLKYLSALRTKPFMLLAGISGTGKSRIVRKLAQATATQEYANEEDRWKDNRPKNFELIQVKPNWHNSMDVVGFYSNISKKYEFTPFVEFIVKAWQNLDTPYFLCLDEMNLAPVEEYFAEFLSAIESRTINEKDEYITDPIIKPFNGFDTEKEDTKVSDQMISKLLGNLDTEEKRELAERFRNKGLTLPQNLIVMGTVNMDETTFSFSRKVLDRAMSVEMNEVDYDKFLSGESDLFPLLTDINVLLVKRPRQAVEVKDGIEAGRVIEYLKAVNGLLDGTPFKLGYRAANEAILYVSACQDFEGENYRIEKALDEFTLMKILSRIEGDDNRLAVDEDDPRVSNIGLDTIKDNGENRVNLLNCLRAIVRQHIGSNTETEKKINTMYCILCREHFVS